MGDFNARFDKVRRVIMQLINDLMATNFILLLFDIREHLYYNVVVLYLRTPAHFS